MNSLKDELAYFFSGQGMPYAKVSLMVAVVTALLFTAIFSNNYVKDANIAVIDMDNSKFSHEFIEELNSSPYIKVKTVLNVPAEPKTLLYQDRYLAVVYLPNGMEKNRYSQSINNIGVFYDNTNSAQTGNLKAALNTVVAIENQKIGSAQIQGLGLSAEQTEAAMNAISLNDRELFNPAGSASNATVLGFLFFFPSMFFVFATIGMVPRLRLMHKWEAELSTRNPFEMMLRIIPYGLCFIATVVVGLCILKFVGDMNFSGDFFVFLLSLCLFVVSLGLMSLFFGWNAANPGIASSRMIFFVPGGFILGGASGPLAILPDWVQTLSNFFPLVWEYRFTRDIILRGASTMDCAREFGEFMIYTVIIAVFFCIRFYRNREELLLQEQNQEDKEILDTAVIVEGFKKG